MFNGVPALPCEQLPANRADCANLFLAADSQAAESRAAAAVAGSAAAISLSSNGAHKDGGRRGAGIPSDSFSEVADRNTAVLHSDAQFSAGANGASQGSSYASGSATATPAKAKRTLCLCSQLGEVHYAHGPGEKPQALRQSPILSPGEAMDLGDDDG